MPASPPPVRHDPRFPAHGQHIYRGSPGESRGASPAQGDGHRYVVDLSRRGGHQTASIRRHGGTAPIVAADFTELQDHNKETEINRALAGEHFYDGFIKNFRKEEAKEIIDSLLTRLNGGERFDAQEVERALGEHVA